MKPFLLKQIRNEQSTKNVMLYLRIVPGLASVTEEGLRQQSSSLQRVEGFDSCNGKKFCENIMVQYT
jgi:hypothetical protein